MAIKDFKKSNGEWVQCTTINGKNVLTRMGRLYGGIKARCNPESYYRRNKPSYENVTNLFIDFQEFAEWCVLQIGYDEEGWHIDKDMLSGDTKNYSKNTCVFIPPQLNTLVVKCDRSRGSLPIGVSFCKTTNLYSSYVSYKGNHCHLGLYKTPLDAFLAYKLRKEAIIKETVLLYEGRIDPHVFKALWGMKLK